MIHLELLQDETLYIAQEMVNSVPEYNRMEVGRDVRSMEEIREEFLQDKTETYFIKLEDTYIGVLDYLSQNPKDGYPWLGLLLIHRDYQGFSYGLQAYHTFEEELTRRGIRVLRLGVLHDNKRAFGFWKKTGFVYQHDAVTKEKQSVHVLEKCIT
ncbi:GNAT family N-acetyltransferase [Pontibacillus salicampi]|uniref:GNAT family N-acetyltransferase n=1 Tax=Pontibacillus salicampi TaxID=1449801 RepID=A0ABV6LPW8_9BACI